MTMRKPRVRTLVPALTLALSAAAVSAAPAAADEGTTMKLRDSVVGHGRSVVATGRVASRETGRQVVLQARNASGAYESVATARTRSGGRYKLLARLPQSARVRVMERTTAASGDASEPAYVRIAARVVSLSRRTNVIAGRSAVVRGRTLPAHKGLRVDLQRRSRGRWVTIARDTTGARGRFRVSERLRRPGVTRMRLRVTRTPTGIASGRRTIGNVEAYRRALASWYGPGLYGNKLGCGGRLSTGTVGVAHKSLPCGTKLVLRHRGREVAARVIDRGPYVGNREFDLTAATKRRLRFNGVGSILVAPRS